MKEIILGTWGMSGAFGERTDSEIRNLLAYAQDIGVQTVDTAIVYGNGRIESILREFPHFKVATKLPATPKLPDGTCQLQDHYNIKTMTDQLEASLRRLGRDVIDVLQLHNWHRSWNSEDILLLLEDFKSQGKILATGVSLPNDFDANIPQGFDLVQLPFNILETWAEKYWNEIPKETRIWVRSIFAHGILAGKTESDMADSDVRKKKYAGIVAALEKHQQQNGKSENLKKLATTYISDQERVDGIIIGCTTKEQIRDAFAGV